MHRFALAGVVAGALTAAALLAPVTLADEATEELVKAAMAADIRTDAEKERDRNRKPVQTLAFFGLKSDMAVLELIPGGGWYTKLLAPTLAEDGELHVAIGTSRVADNLVDQPGFEKIKVLDVDPGFDRSGPFNTVNMTNELDFGKRKYDMVLTFRNVHNFTPEARAKMNEAVFKALKKGGVYGVVDHTARHMEPMTAENRRRADPVQIIKEITAAGFVLDDYSDLHYRPDDELRYEVGRKSVTGNTDRFTLRFVKP